MVSVVLVVVESRAAGCVPSSLQLQPPPATSVGSEDRPREPYLPRLVVVVGQQRPPRVVVVDVVQA